MISRSFVGGQEALQVLEETNEKGRQVVSLLRDYEEMQQPDMHFEALLLDDAEYEILEHYVGLFENTMFTDVSEEFLFKTRRSSADKGISLRKALKVFGLNGVHDAIEFGSFKILAHN